jgi:hypothetical protein
VADTEVSPFPVGAASKKVEPGAIHGNPRELGQAAQHRLGGGHEILIPDPQDGCPSA